jgi:hypothetical protein
LSLGLNVGGLNVKAPQKLNTWAEMRQEQECSLSQHHINTTYFKSTLGRHKKKKMISRIKRSPIAYNRKTDASLGLAIMMMEKTATVTKMTATMTMKRHSCGVEAGQWPRAWLAA